MKKKDLFFIASAWNTGTGFMVKGYNFIITTVQIVGFSKNVIIKKHNSSEKLVNVLFTDYSSGLAFVENPFKANTSLDIIDFEMSAVEQIVTLYKTNYYNEFMLKKCEISENNFTHNNIRHQLLNIKTPEKEGAIIINAKNEFVGIVKYLENEQKNIILPAKYILKTMEEYSGINEKAVRCTNCHNIVKLNDIINYNCPICSAEIVPQLLEDKTPALTATDKKIETALKQCGYDLKYARLGQHCWEIKEGSANIIIRYEPELKFIVTFSVLYKLGNNNEDKIYTYLLKENKNLKHFYFSINKKNIYLSTPYFIDEDFDKNFAKNIFNELFQKANYYDDILKEMNNI